MITPGDVPLPRRLHRLGPMWAFDRRDQADRSWWPQGVCWAGERMLVSWHARGHGSRISVLDLVARRYGHVPLLHPDGGPLRAHAGGLALVDRWLYVAATGAGLWMLHLDDLTAAGWPARRLWHPGEGDLRWSFVDHDPDPDVGEGWLLAGEYGRGSRTRRLHRVALVGGEPAGAPDVMGDGPRGMQGAARLADGRLALTTSHGPWTPGTLWVGRPGDWTPHRWRFPMGPEDLTRSRDGRLWTVCEHPWRRAVLGVRA